MNTKNDRLIQFAFWLIKLRWIGVLGIILVTFISSTLLKISVKVSHLCIISVFFLMVNVIFFLALKRIMKMRPYDYKKPLKKLIIIQISTDLLILTIMLHYSGGVENPFIIYYIFHMIIGSLVLSFRESFLQTSFALFLIGLLALSEYTGIIPHYKLEGFISFDLYKSGKYLIGTGIIFITTSYLIVYVTCSLAARARKNEEAVIKANVELQDKDLLKNEYVLRLTHDIKGHLAAIQSCLVVVIQKLHDPDKNIMEEFLGRAFKRTNSLIQLVKDLFSLTKMRIDNKFQTDTFSIRKSVGQVLDKIEAMAGEKSIEVKIDMEKNLGELSGNSNLIEEVIYKLLMNAIKYSEKNSWVMLRIINHGNNILAEVTDNGIGIPMDERSKVFDEFFRATNSKKANIAGSGMGLSIAKQIILMHGGEIWVESQEGAGSTFYFTIPK